MDFWATLRLMGRRWYVVLPALILGAGLTILTYQSIPTRYESTGVAVLTAPSAGSRFSAGTTPADVVQINPLLAFDGSLTTTAQIITQVLRDPQTREELGAGADSQSTYLANNGDLNGPFVFVSTDSDSAAEAQALVGRVLDRAGIELESRQRELQAPVSTFITPQVLVRPTVGEPQIGGKIRFAGAAMVLSLILALAVTFAAESLIQAVRRHRAGDAVPVPHRGDTGRPVPASRPAPTPRPRDGTAPTARPTSPSSLVKVPSDSAAVGRNGEGGHDHGAG